MPAKLTVQRYGVGFGTGLRSKKIGMLKTALYELGRLIEAGLNPRHYQVLPVDKCSVCKGESWSKSNSRATRPEICSHCNGFGWNVQNKGQTERNRLAIDTDDVTAVCMSKPSTTANERRSWLARRPGQEPALVRIYPDETFSRDPGSVGTVYAGGRRTALMLFVCDCPDGKARKACIHIRAVEAIDARKFGIKDGKK